LPVLSVARAIQQIDIALIGNTLSDPRQQLLHFDVTRGTDLFVQHHHSCKPFPEHVGFIVLMPLFDSERFSFVPREITAGDQDTPFLHWPELLEIPEKEDDWDPTEILCAAAQAA
jgi:hypothetical protein